MQQIPAITREGMIEVDRVMTDELGVGVELMMELAGLNLARVVRDYQYRLKAERVTVIAGSGHNGGGGIVAARRLKNWGVDVILILPKGMPKKHIPQLQLQRAQDCGIRIHYQMPSQDSQNQIVIDAYIGYNFHGELVGEAKTVVDWMRKQKLICLDMPSGVDSTSGGNKGLLEPLATVTLAWPKIGLLHLHATHLGDVYLVDIGIPYWVYDNSKLYYSEKATIRDIKAIATHFAKYSVLPISISKKGWSIITKD